MTELSTLPAMAQRIGAAFPELSGRCLPVSEAEITKENIPTLPLGMVALSREDGDHIWKTGTGNLTIAETVIFEMWMKPERYKRADRTETPFWAFYDYDPIRDRLLDALIGWRTPRGGLVEYKRMDIEATALAVVLTFTLVVHWKWCRPDIAEDDCVEPDLAKDGMPATVIAGICAPVSLLCGPPFDNTKEQNPCE